MAHTSNIVPGVAQTCIFWGEIADWPSQTSATNFPVAERLPMLTWKI
jgi:hypothetical protein